MIEIIIGFGVLSGILIILAVSDWVLAKRIKQIEASIVMLLTDAIKDKFHPVHPTQNTESKLKDYINNE